MYMVPSGMNGQHPISKRCSEEIQVHIQ